MQYLWLILQQPGPTATILEAENLVGEGLRRWGQKMNRMFKNILWAVKNNIYNAYMYMQVLNPIASNSTVSRALMIAGRVLPRGSVDFGIHVNNKTPSIYEVKYIHITLKTFSARYFFFIFNMHVVILFQYWTNYCKIIGILAWLEANTHVC